MIKGYKTDSSLFRENKNVCGNKFYDPERSLYVYCTRKPNHRGDHKRKEE